MVKKILFLTFMIFSLKSFSVIPREIHKIEFYTKYSYKRRKLELKSYLKIDKKFWPYVRSYWKVFYNRANKVIAETLYVRGCRIAYWSYKYQRDGRIIKKGFHWGGIRGGVYYDMGWKRYRLKRGFSFYNSRFSYKVYDKAKKLIYEEFYIKGRFEHFVRYYYDSSGHFLRLIRSCEHHLRGSYYDYIYNGRPVYPHSVR